VAATLNRTGAGTLVLATAATQISDGTQINVAAGTLNSNNATALGTLAQVSVASGATINVGASQTFGALSGKGTVNLNTNTLTVGSTNNLSATFDGVLADGSGAGKLVTAGTGTLRLTGANTYTGGTTVSAGTLLVSNTTGSGTGTGAV